MIKSKRDAFAAHCGLDLADTEDYRYHYGHTTQPVWAISNGYYCVTKGSQKPAKHILQEVDWVWVEKKDDFLNKDGYKIWWHKSETE